MDAKEFYVACNLKDNPFRPTPMYDSDPRIGVWAGYEKERQTLEKFLVRSRNDQIGNTNLLLVYGDYGNGKSHALLWCKSHIQQHQNEFNSIAFYVQTLKKDGGKLTFAGALEHDIVGKSNLLEELHTFKTFLKNRLFEYKHSNNLTEKSDEDVLPAVIPSQDLANFAARILKSETPEQIRAEIFRPKLSDYEATISFASIVNLFTYKFDYEGELKSFKKAVYLFIDELDLLAQSSAKEAREVNDLIRHLYDSCPHAFCMLLAFTASVAEVPLLFAPYVISRVARQIVLEPLDPSSATQFVREILDNERINGAGKKGFYPFEESAIDTIVSSITTITPRKIINIMQQVLEEVRLKDFIPERNNLISREFLDGQGILEEVMA